MLRDGRSKAAGHTCAHQAGHAAVQWYLGFPIDHVYVLAEPMRTAEGWHLGRLTGGEILCEPSVQGDSSAYAQAWRKHETGRAERFLMMVAAGPIAEAIQRHWARVAIWLAPQCQSDTVRALDAISRCRLEGGERALDEACVRANALLQAPAMRTSVAALAAALGEGGRLAGSEVDEICGRSFAGRRPAIDTWAEAWPPSLADLRASRVPVFADDRAALDARFRRHMAAVSAASAEATVERAAAA